MRNKRKVIIVANSDHVFDINNHIQEKDLIVRFNIPKISSLKPTATRTDFLFLANSVDVVQKKLRNNSKFIRFLSTIDNKFTVVFPYSDELIKMNKPQYKKKIFIFFRKLTNNFNNSQYISFLNQLGFNVHVLADHYYLNLKNQIDPESNKILSTGIIAAYYFLTNPDYEDTDIYLHGFTFEGWNGHAWDKEKQYLNELIVKNKIHLFDQTT